MLASNIMTPDPKVCYRQSSLEEVARIMAESDVGEVPVLESKEAPRLCGVVTDRDIVCRSLGQGHSPAEMNAGDVMSSSPATVQTETRIEDCVRLMKERRIRRLPVVNDQNHCIGMLAQADIALYLTPESAGETVREVSQPA